MDIFIRQLEIVIPSSYAEWEIYHNISKEEIFFHIPEINYDKNHSCFTSKNHHHFIAKLHNEYAGILQLENLGSAELALRIIAVKEEFQRKGIGKILLSFTKKFCIMHSLRTIRTHANLRAVEFYKKNGFKEEFWADCSINEGTLDMMFNLNCSNMNLNYNLF